MILNPFFKLFKWFKREYIANKIAGDVNAFVSQEFKIGIFKKYDYNLKIRWVKNPDDPILQEKKLIVRMRKEEDQTRNILTATQIALPKILFPLLRGNISSTCSNAIDFTFLHKLAEKLGNHGRAVFKRYFLNPEAESNPLLVELLKKLLILDRRGIFIPIFINELENISEGVYASSDLNDKTNEIVDFIEYLITIAEREIGSEIELCYNSTLFQVGAILLAKRHIANKRGLFPYLRRLNINIDKGCSSIYIIAFPPAIEFLDKLIKVLDGNDRLQLNNVYTVGDSSYMNNPQKLKIACFHINKIYSKDTFRSKITACNIEVGDKLEGLVIDVSINEALISIKGMDAVINRHECSWISHLSCSDVLRVGEKCDFLIKDINYDNNTLISTLRFPEDNPWYKVTIPNIGSVITVKILSKNNIQYRCLYENALEILMPIDEASWFILSETERRDLINREVQVKVIEKNDELKSIKCSIRDIEENPWPKIHQSLKVGTKFHGKVVEILDDFVRVQIDGAYIGVLPKESLTEAGFEYSKYKESMIVGQGVDVVVTKVFIAKKKIRLDLQRNLAKKSRISL